MNKYVQANLDPSDYSNTQASSLKKTTATELHDDISEFNQFFHGEALTKEEEDLIKELKARETEVEKQFKQQLS